MKRVLSIALLLLGIAWAGNVHAQFVGGTPVTLQNVDDTATVNGTNMGSFGVLLQAGSFVGQLVAECAGDPQGYTATLFDVKNTSIATVYTVTAPTAIQMVSIVPVEGCRNYRVRVLNVSTGTISATVFGSLTVTPSNHFIGPPNTGNMPPTIAITGGSDGTTLRTFATTPSGALYVAPTPGLPLPRCNALVKRGCQ